MYSTVVDCCMQAADAVKGSCTEAPCNVLVSIAWEVWLALHRGVMQSIRVTPIMYNMSHDHKRLQMETLSGAHPSVVSNGAHRKGRMNEVSIDRLPHSHRTFPQKLIILMGCLLCFQLPWTIQRLKWPVFIVFTDLQNISLRDTVNLSWSSVSCL